MTLKTVQLSAEHHVRHAQEPLARYHWLVVRPMMVTYWPLSADMTISEVRAVN